MGIFKFIKALGDAVSPIKIIGSAIKALGDIVFIIAIIVAICVLSH